MNLSINKFRTIDVFANKAGKTARRLNQLAIKELKTESMEYTFPKATVEDLKRLTSKKIEDTYKRVAWTNPKDGKVYHILEEGRNKEGISVRILSSEGKFIKNAILKPKTIVIFDQFKNLGWLKDLLKLKRDSYPSHGEIVETYLRRTNPFATIKRLEHKKNIFEQIKYRGSLPVYLTEKRFEELSKSIKNGKKVDYISMSEVAVCDIGHLAHSNSNMQKVAIEHNIIEKNFNGLAKIFKSIIHRGGRIFMSAGNEIENPNQKVNAFLAIDGIEGVGSLARNGKIAKDSASRKSIFTQHYEQRNFQGKIVEEDGKIIGINITGKSGAELPYNKKYQHLLRSIGGTSYSTPIRVGKVSLNDMMEGIL